MMNDATSITQLAAEMAQLRQQIEQMNQRLDMIYGAVTRLAETAPHPPAEPLKHPTRSAPAVANEVSFSAQALLNPGSMLASLHQHALQAGLTIPADSMERLQAELPPVTAEADH